MNIRMILEEIVLGVLLLVVYAVVTLYRKVIAIVGSSRKALSRFGVPNRFANIGSSIVWDKYRETLSVLPD
jgi:hypothetical protein